MTAFKFVSGIFRGGRLGKQNKSKNNPPQLGVCIDGRQKKAEGFEPHEKLKPGWFYWKLGRLIGPFDDVEIFDLLDKGELHEDSMVTLMNVPLAMLLKDPAQRLEFQTMVHLKKPGLENADVTRPDAKEYAMATHPELLGTWSENVTAWLLSDPVERKKIAEDLVAATAEPEKDVDAASVVHLEMDRVSNDGKKSQNDLTRKVDYGNADASASMGERMKRQSDSSEMRYKADGEALEIISAKLRRNSAKVGALKSASVPSRKGPRSAVFPPGQLLGEAVKAKGEVVKMDASELRKGKVQVGFSERPRRLFKGSARNAGHHESRKAKPERKRRRPVSLKAFT